MADGITLDTSSFSKFARDLRRCEPLILKELNTALKAAGEIVAVDARTNAGFSKRIPSGIKVRRGGMRVRVVAKDTDPKHKGEARAFEHKGNDGTFRHPVFGDRNVWVDQQAHPFLGPAARANRETAVKMCEVALHRAYRLAGLRW